MVGLEGKKAMGESLEQQGSGGRGGGGKKQRRGVQGGGGGGGERGTLGVCWGTYMCVMWENIRGRF